MSNSPSVNITEQVVPNPLLPSSGLFTVMIGAASKGTPGIFNLIASTDDFIKNYGSAIPASSNLYFAVQQYLQFSSGLFVARAIDDLSQNGLDSYISKIGIHSEQSGIADDLVTVKAVSPGTWGNGISVKFTNVSVDTYAVEVFYNGVLVERFLNCSIEDEATNFMETNINGKSAYISVDVNTDVESGGFDIITDTTLTVSLAGGNDGVANQTSLLNNIVALLNKLKDKDAYVFDFVIVPDFGFVAQIQAALVDLVTTRNDCQSIVDMPFALGTLPNPIPDALLWEDGQNNSYPSVNFNNENIFAYGFWQKDLDPSDKTYKWFPPSIYMVQKFAYLEATKKRWYAAAGFDDGKLTTVDVQYSPSFADREQLYGTQINGAIHAINPIVKFPAEGIVVYGQRTTKRSEDPTNRINVVVMLNYLKQQLYKIGKRLQFKINDDTLWTQFETEVGNVLNYIQSNHGLSNFKIIPGSVTNTPDIIANNKSLFKITVVPEAIAEEVDFVLNVSPQGVAIQ